MQIYLKRESSDGILYLNTTTHRNNFLASPAKAKEPPKCDGLVPSALPACTQLVSAVIECWICGGTMQKGWRTMEACNDAAENSTEQTRCDRVGVSARKPWEDIASSCLGEARLNWKPEDVADAGIHGMPAEEMKWCAHPHTEPQLSSRPRPKPEASCYLQFRIGREYSGLLGPRRIHQYFQILEI